MKEEFLKELKELLNRYNVEITADVGEGSDLYGIYDRVMEIWHVNPKIHEYEKWLEVTGWEINGRNL